MRVRHDANTRARFLGSLLVASITLAGLARSAPMPSFNISLNDGSQIVARATSNCLPFQTALIGEVELNWSSIRSLKFGDGKVVVDFPNGDHLSGQLTQEAFTVDTAFGQISIPRDQIRTIAEIKITTAPRENIALGKAVTGQDGASHGKGLAAHVTDGDLSTHAKPPAFHFDYTVDLRTPNEDGFSVGEIVIHWGHYGDRFKGIRKGDGWSSGSWPGEYVKSYRLDYRCVSSDEWVELRHWAGRPADETGEDIRVQKTPTQREGASSDIKTTITGLKLENVAEIRIRAQGGHWIGLFELEVFRGG